MRASRTSIGAGDVVTFEAFTAYGGAFVVQGWAWQPAAPTFFIPPGFPLPPGFPAPPPPAPPTNVSACATATTCSVPVNDSGYVIVDATLVTPNGDVPVEARVKIVTVPRLVVTLTASDTVLGIGDTVTFTGSVTPTGVPYRVLGWRYDTGGSGVTTAGLKPRVASRARGTLRAAQTGVGTARSRTARRATLPSRDATPNGDSTAGDSLSTPDTLTTYEAPDGSDLIPPLPDDSPPTQACDAAVGLICRIPIYQSGTLTLLVQVGNVQFSASVAPRIKLECPPYAPMDGVLDPSSQGPFAASQGMDTRFGLIRNFHFQTTGPYKFDGEPGIDEIYSGDGSPPRGWFQVKSAKILDVPFTRPEFFMFTGGTIQFWCKTSKSKAGYVGRLEYSGRSRLSWTALY